MLSGDEKDPLEPKSDVEAVLTDLLLFQQTPISFSETVLSASAAPDPKETFVLRSEDVESTYYWSSSSNYLFFDGTFFELSVNGNN